MILFFFLFNYIITDIDVEARWTDPQLILEASGLQKNSQFKAEYIQQAITNLSKLKLFNFIAIDSSIIGDGIFLKIIVDEAPFLKSEPRFINNLKIKNKTLKDKIDLRIGQVLTNKVIFDSKNKIIELYKEKAFYKTTVRDSIVKDTLNRTQFFLIIEEGIEPRIGTIEIIGNNAFSDSEIKRKMSNREKAFLRGGKLNEEKLKEDVEKIESFYKEKGFLDVRVDKPTVQVEDDKFIITITIQENEKYYVGYVTFRENTVFDTLQLRKLLKYRTGDIYNLREVEETLQNFHSAYGDEGYIYCTIMPSETIRDSFIDIEYIFDESMPARINRVTITGNYNTREKVIRREIVSFPGNTLRTSEIIRSQRQIFNLGYFEDIQIGTGTPDDSGNIDLVYRLTEKEGVATFGGGIAYSALDKITGYVELSHPNLFGKGQRIHTKVELGGRLTNFQIGFTEPWLFGTRKSAGLDVYYTNRLWDYYTKRDVGFSGRISFPFYLDYTRFSYTFRTERTQVLDISETYVPPSSGYSLYDDTIPKWTVANTFGITRDTRDYIFNPSSGSYISFRSEIAKKFLFANVDYNRFTFETRVYFPIFWKFVLMNRMKMGVVTSGDDVPLYKRFYAGGIGENGVRGYADRSLTPIEDGRTVGGNALFINNIELKLKFSRSFAFLLFYDAGNAFESYKEFNFHNLYRGMGAGVRLEVPMMGVIGLDLGYGLDDENPSWVPHFQINPFGMF